jgi:stage V sporulation protein D (sporulation-specific penicillin-binding protein)
MVREVSEKIIRRRTAALFFICSALILFLVLRLGYIQIISNAKYLELALDQRLRPVSVDAKRGTIYDRNERELAISVSADAVYVIPAEVVDPTNVARVLSEILELDYDTVYAKVTKNVVTEWIARKVTADKAQLVRQAKLPGIGITERAQRFYPKDTLAAHILGIAGIDNQGLEGLEIYYERYLAGVPGQIVAERDARNKSIPEGVRMYVPPQEGYDIYLTIDEVIQYILERELTKAVEETKSKSGVGIIMNTQTGEILAMVTVPTFDPNFYNEYPTSNRRNIAVTDMFEPGSTFKIITAAAVLEEGLVKPDEVFVDPGYIKVGDRIIHCWREGGHGSQTFVEAVENSCNVVFVTLGLRLTKEKFYEYIRAFGFGQRPELDFPGVSAGLLMSLNSVGPVEQANISFGQGISVTPLQMVTALSAIANGGTLMKPMLVKEVRDADGNVVATFEPRKVRQVISKETAVTLMEILESVVVNGSGSRAAVDGYRVGGKTGTAQKPEEGRYGEERTASFVGFLPVSDPQLAAVIILDELQVNPKYGGTWAAPVFQAVMQDVVRYLEIAPDKAGKQQTQKDTSVIVPNVTGLFIEDAEGVILRSGLSSRVVGEGSVVLRQVPESGAEVSQGTTVLLYLKEGTGSETMVVVPDVLGNSMKKVSEILSDAGLRLSPVGTGIAVKQDPMPGESVLRGTKVEVYFEGR